MEYLMKLTKTMQDGFDKVWEYITTFRNQMNAYCDTNNQFVKQSNEQMLEISSVLKSHRDAIEQISQILAASGIVQRTRSEKVIKKETTH